MQNILAQFAEHVLAQAPGLLNAAWQALAPHLGAKVRVVIRVEVDGPGALDPVVEVAATGSVDLHGISLGEPTARVIRTLS